MMDHLGTEQLKWCCRGSMAFRYRHATAFPSWWSSYVEVKYTAYILGVQTKHFTPCLTGHTQSLDWSNDTITVGGILGPNDVPWSQKTKKIDSHTVLRIFIRKPLKSHQSRDQETKVTCLDADEWSSTTTAISCKILLDSITIGLFTRYEKELADKSLGFDDSLYCLFFCTQLTR